MRRDLRLAVAGRTVSMFGDHALWLANGIWVKQLTGSTAAAGLVFFFYGAASLAAPLAGLLVDRVRRRPLLVTTEALLGVAVLSLLLVRGPGQVWLIYAITFVYGLAGTVTASARSALFRVLIPDDEQLARVNGLLQTLQQGLGLVAPATGAALFAAFGGPAVVLVDVATFVVVVAAFSALRVDEPDPVPAAGGWRHEIAGGVRHLWRTIDLRRMTIAIGTALLVVGFGETLIFAIATVGLHRSPSFVGVLTSGQGAGAIIGGLLAARLIRRLGESRACAIGLALLGVGAFGLVTSSVPLTLVATLVFGVGVPVLIVGLFTALQRLTPIHLQGRAYSAVDVLITTPQTLSIGLGAALIAVVDYRVLLVVMGTVIGASAAWLGTRRPVPSTGPEPEPAVAAECG